jgi:hypothetical protein
MLVAGGRLPGPRGPGEGGHLGGGLDRAAAGAAGVPGAGCGCPGGAPAPGVCPTGRRRDRLPVGGAGHAGRGSPPSRRAQRGAISLLCPTNTSRPGPGATSSGSRGDGVPPARAGSVRTSPGGAQLPTGGHGAGAAGLVGQARTFCVCRRGTARCASESPRSTAPRQKGPRYRASGRGALGAEADEGRGLGSPVGTPRRTTTLEASWAWSSQRRGRAGPRPGAAPRRTARGRPCPRGAPGPGPRGGRRGSPGGRRAAEGSGRAARGPPAAPWARDSSASCRSAFCSPGAGPGSRGPGRSAPLVRRS